MSCAFGAAEGCNKPTRIRYPGNDPENGPAREYCHDGHSTCYNCGKWFQAIMTTPAFTDDETFIVVPESKHESDWCPPCEAEHNATHCACGASRDLHEHNADLSDTESVSWMCCSDPLCCDGATKP